MLMYLKTDTVLLQCTLHQLRYFITTSLCLAEIYQQMFQPCSFNENDLMVLFIWGWPHLMNKLSLISSLNLFVSEARISK